VAVIVTTAATTSATGWRSEPAQIHLLPTRCRTRGERYEPLELTALTVGTGHPGLTSNELLELGDNELWDLICGRSDCLDPRLIPTLELLRRA